MRNQKEEIAKIKEFSKVAKRSYKAIAEDNEISTKVFYNWLSGGNALTNVQIEKLTDYMNSYVGFRQTQTIK